MKPVVGRRVPDALDSEEAGTFSFKAGRILCNCPCGCGSAMNLPVYRAGQPKPAPNAWEWNGDEDRPTLKPSIRDLSGCRFHGYLTDGVWSFCGDSGR